MQEPRFTEEKVDLVFREKSPEYPGGRIAFLADGRVIFPEMRFLPEVGKKYSCLARFYEKRDSIIGIAYPIEKEMSENEYLRDEQVVISVTFVRERDSGPIARHPITGAYIVPTEISWSAIKEGSQCWVMVVQRGTTLVAHYIKDVEGAEKPPSPGTAIAPYDPSFAASAEQALLAKKGMGRPPVFPFRDRKQFPWEIMGIGREAETEEIRQAYRSLAPKLHPDQNPKASHEDFVALAHAHDWMTFRRQWIDDIARKTAAISRPKPTKTKKSAPEHELEPKTAGSRLDEDIDNAAKTASGLEERDDTGAVHQGKNGGKGHHGTISRKKANKKS